MGYRVDPNAKNVWVRDNADTMDLPVQTDANSVYFNNGRTMEQEFGKGTMSSNVVTVDSGMEKVIDGTYDGAYESCKMYGKSLVNLINYNDSNINTSGKYVQFNSMVWDVVGKTVTVFNYGSKTVRTQMSKNGTYYRQLDFEPNTKTLVKLESDEKLERIRGLSAENWTLDEVGLNELKTTTMILEGDYTKQDVPFFEGLCDVKMPILKSTGKNLIENLPRLSANGISIQPTNNPTQVVVNGVATDITDYYVAEVKMNNNSHIFNIEVGESLTLSNSLGKKCYFGQDKNGITEWTSPSLTKKDGGTNLRCFIRFNQGDSFDNETMTVQIEQGLTATEFEPYKTNILETSNDVVLRGLPNGVKDSYDCLTGEYAQRVSGITLDGTQSVSMDGTLAYIHITDLVENNVSMSDALPSVRVNDVLEGVEGVAVQNRGNNSRIYININGLTTAEEITQRLQQKPVTIQYQLAEPIVTTIEPSTTSFAYENGHIILESGHEGQSLLPTLEYQTVVSRSGQVAMIDKTIQQHEHKITLLEKMLVQNIIDIEYKNTLLALKLEIDEVI